MRFQPLCSSLKNLLRFDGDMARFFILPILSLPPPPPPPPPPRGPLLQPISKGMRGSSFLFNSSHSEVKKGLYDVYQSGSEDNLKKLPDLWKKRPN